MSRSALYPGSFDPITLGHIDVIGRAAGVFDRVVVGVLVNPKKTPLLELNERVNTIREAVDEALPAAHGRIEVASFDGLTVDYAASVAKGTPEEIRVLVQNAVDHHVITAPTVATDDAAAFVRARGAAHEHGGWMLREAGGPAGDDGFGRALPNTTLMQRIKDAFDPGGRCNPGRMPLPSVRVDEVGT